jgi:hypothetical protein
MGRQALSDPKAGPPIAAACWEGLLNTRPYLAEEVGEYENSRQPMFGGGLAGVLRLYQELASLYSRYPELDPGGAKLNRIVQGLFEGKAQFILERKWKATQPFHTVLAQIFVQRGVLDRGVTGAAYQLRATLDDADRRWRDPQEQFFQPLPEIKALLAQTYLRLGPTRSQDAMRMYIGWQRRSQPRGLGAPAGFKNTLGERTGAAADRAAHRTGKLCGSHYARRSS